MQGRRDAGEVGTVDLGRAPGVARGGEPVAVDPAAHGVIAHPEERGGLGDPVGRRHDDTLDPRMRIERAV